MQRHQGLHRLGCPLSGNCFQVLMVFFRPGSLLCWLDLNNLLYLGRAAQLVLKAHKDAVSSLGGNGSSALGTVAAVVAAANATAKEAAKELAAALQSSTVEASNNGSEATDGVMDSLSIMKVESCETGSGNFCC